MVANMETTKQIHDRYCMYPRSDVALWGRYGDIRRCGHGKIMLGYEVLGTIPPYWRTLHPFWTPILFWRARKVLRNSDGGDSTIRDPEKTPMRLLRHVHGNCEGCGVSETTWCKSDCSRMDPMDYR